MMMMTKVPRQTIENGRNERKGQKKKRNVQNSVFALNIYII